MSNSKNKRNNPSAINHSKKQITELTKKVKADLYAWLEEHRHPVPGHTEIEPHGIAFSAKSRKPGLTSIKESLERAFLDGGTALLRKLRLSEYDREAQEIEDSYNKAVNTVDYNNPRNMMCLDFNLTPTKNAVHELIETLDDVEQNVKADLPKEPTVPEPTEASGGEKTNISKEEANVRARTLIKENPNYTTRQLSKKIPCALGLVSQLPTYRALQEYKKRTFGSKKPKVIPLTKELETCLGSEDEQLQQLIAEQTKDDKQTPRLYVRKQK